MTDIFIAGVGMTQFGSQPAETVNSLNCKSVSECLENAGAEARQLETVFYSNGAKNQTQGLAGEVALHGTGLNRLPAVNVQNDDTGGSTTFWLARDHLLSGQSDIVMAVGTEKVLLNDTKFSNIENYIMLCRAHMAKFGTTKRQLAVISSKNHANSTINPNCLFNRAFSVEEIIDAQSLAYPLTVPMVAQPSDGSAAVLLCTRKGFRKLNGSSKPIRVDSCVRTLSEPGESSPRDWGDFENHLARRTASAAYAQAGIGPEDVDLAEVQDLASFGELLMTELLGFCEIGGGGQFAETGVSSLTGRLPVNPSGGLESKGHPISATGLGQIYELVIQLRGVAGPRQLEHALVAVQENGGGMLGIEDSAAVVTVLSR